MAWLAKTKFNKITCILNHTVDPANSDVYKMISKIYANLDIVYVRETLSLKKLHEIGINNAKFVPDALFHYTPSKEWNPSIILSKQIDFSQPYICIGDSSGIKNRYNQVKWDVYQVLFQLIIELKKIIPQIIFIDGYNGSNEDINKVIRKMHLGFVNVNNCSYNDLFYVLKGSEVFISGRWHASILSVLARTPILLWGADSHKTRSLYTLLDYPYEFFEVNTLPIHIDDIIKNTQKIIEQKQEIKNLYEQKLSTLVPRAEENASFLGAILS
jgi:polysaccharide pyruvyl transferase WcaK-like protein